MLIRGLQNPFVTRSISFQHKYVERSSYLVFVPSAPCCFFSIYLLSPKWLLVKIVVIIKLRISFVPLVRMILVKTMLHFNPLFQLIPSFNQIADWWSSLSGWLRNGFPTLTQRVKRFQIVLLPLLLRLRLGERLCRLQIRTPRC